jgi:hypothetical protein
MLRNRNRQVARCYRPATLGSGALLERAYGDKNNVEGVTPPTGNHTFLIPDYRINIAAA